MRQRPRADLPETVELGDVFNANNGVGHGGRVEWSRVESRGLWKKKETRVEGWMKKGESSGEGVFRRWTLVSGRSTPTWL
jgi:hypothetical protein